MQPIVYRREPAVAMQHIVELVSIWLQVECMPPGKMVVVVTEYIIDNSTISLHFTGVGAAGSLQAVQIGHSDGVRRSIPRSSL